MRNYLLLLVFFLLVFSNIAFAVNVSACGTLNTANTIYLLNQSVTAGSTTCFPVTASNITLDGQGYTIALNPSITTGNAVNVNGYHNFTLKNANVSWPAGASNTHAIYLINSNDSTIYNNSINVAVSRAIYLSGSGRTNISNNNITITNSGDGVNGHGIYLWSGSNDNIAENNNIYSPENTDMGTGSGVYIYSSYRNSIANGSIYAPYSRTIFIGSTDGSNNFTNTNFTGLRTIQLYDAASWFNYRNDSSNTWLKTKVSADSYLNRTHVNWNKTLMKWNDTPSATITATYIITGLQANKGYAIYNTSNGVKTKSYTRIADSNGDLSSFTIILNSNTEIYAELDDVPPAIIIVEPLNTTYDNTLSIPLSVSISETTSWCGYSLNENANVSFTPNTTITASSSLVVQNVRVYCNDSVGNMNASEIRYFSINSNVILTKIDGTALDSIVVDSDETVTRTYLMNNTGVTDLTVCNFTFVNRSAGTSLNAYATFNTSNFNLSAGQNTSFKMTLSNVPASGSIYYEKILATCAETTASISVDVSSSSPSVVVIPSGGGGGGGEPSAPSSVFVVFKEGGRYLGLPLTLSDCAISGKEKKWRLAAENRGNVTATPTSDVSESLKGIITVKMTGEPVPPSGTTPVVISAMLPGNSTIGDKFEGRIYIISGSNQVTIDVSLKNEKACLGGDLQEPIEAFKKAFFTTIIALKSTNGNPDLRIDLGHMALLASIFFLYKKPEKKLAGLVIFAVVLYGGSILFG